MMRPIHDFQGTSSAWQLWHNDLFDRDSPSSLQASGTNIVEGLYKLWFHTLMEGMLETGSASFSRFHLTWGNTAFTRADIYVEPFNNRSLLKLRQWVKPASQGSSNEEQQGKKILLRLAELHCELLQKGDRWKGSAIDWSTESKELLARVDLAKEPEEL